MVQFAHVMQTAEPQLRVGLSMDVIFVKQACGDISACLKEHCFNFTVHLGSKNCSCTYKANMMNSPHCAAF